MAFQFQTLTSLIVIDPELAKRQILDAYREAGASMRDAAKILGCGERTLHRWVQKLNLKPTIVKLEKRATREGWHHHNVGGRPKEA